MPIFEERPGDISIPSYFTKGLLLLFVTDTKKPFVIAAVFWTPSKIKNYRKFFCFGNWWATCTGTNPTTGIISFILLMSSFWLSKLR